MRTTTRKILRSSALAGLSAIAIGGALSPAHGAATASVAVDGEQLTYVGTNDRNEVKILSVDGKILLSDRIRITSGNGCRAPNPAISGVVECSGSIASLKAELADGSGLIKVGVFVAGPAFGRGNDGRRSSPSAGDRHHFAQ
ncbi:hypothetical protein [Streptosporangium sp. OZ121]|uniref:hypothetical protein n=1 Tax=Streptosporangium sp. OZ121 TaxID=3444183 RepID=UPI003F7B31A5